MEGGVKRAIMITIIIIAVGAWVRAARPPEETFEPIGDAGAWR